MSDEIRAAKHALEYELVALLTPVGDGRKAVAAIDVLIEARLNAAVMGVIRAPQSTDPVAPLKKPPTRLLPPKPPHPKG